MLNSVKRLPNVRVHNIDLLTGLDHANGISDEFYQVSRGGSALYKTVLQERHNFLAKLVSQGIANDRLK